MKAPDKIYLHRTTGNPRLNDVVHSHKPAKIRFDDKIIEYIRKDTLLEWLEQNRNQVQMWFDRYKDKEDLSAKQVWEEVIAKINDL